MKYALRTTLKIMMVTSIVMMLSAFGGCATDGPAPTAQTTIYQIEQQYNHALAVGAWYGSLDDCGAPLADSILCSKADIRVKIKQAKDVAGPIIAGARATVRNPLFDQSTADRIILTAQNALAVLTVITEPLEALLNQAIQQGKAKPISAITVAPSVAALPDVPQLPAPVFADMSVLAILTLLNTLLKVIPEGTAQWLKFKQDKEKYEAIRDAGRDPTDEEWQALVDETAALEAQIDENAAGGSDT